MRPKSVPLSESPLRAVQGGSTLTVSPVPLFSTSVMPRQPSGNWIGALFADALPVESSDTGVLVSFVVGGAAGGVCGSYAFGRRWMKAPNHRRCPLNRLRRPSKAHSSATCQRLAGWAVPLRGGRSSGLNVILSDEPLHLSRSGTSITKGLGRALLEAGPPFREGQFETPL